MEYPPEGMRHTTDNTEIVMYVTDRQAETEEGYLQGQKQSKRESLKIYMANG